MEVEELRDRIEELEKEKTQLIDRIKELNRRLRYKQYEHKALAPFIEETKEVDLRPYQRQKRAIEFKISTSAYTPAMERQMLKKLKKIEEKLSKYEEIEKARRKFKYVVKDIETAEKEIEEIEARLKQIREELKKLYAEYKIAKKSVKPSDFVSLEDIALIENEK